MNSERVKDRDGIMGLGLVMGLGTGMSCIFGYDGFWIWWQLAMADRVVADFRLVPLQTSNQSPLLPDQVFV